MGIKGKISFAAFTLGICGVLTAIIFCAVERVELSCIVGAVTAAVCCIGCYFGFESWEEEEPEDEHCQAAPEHVEGNVTFENVVINGERMKNLKGVVTNDFIKGIRIK